MNRQKEIHWLVPILSLIALGCLLAYLAFADRQIPVSLFTPNGTLNLAPYFQTPYPNLLYGPLFFALFLLIHLFLRLCLPKADPFILPVLALLSGLGLILTLRLSPDLATSRSEVLLALLSRHPNIPVKDNIQTLAQLGMKQFIFITLGGLLMILTIKGLQQRTFSWLSFKKYFWVIVSAGLIILTLLSGKKINGRSLWLFGFQTVELVKLLMLFFIAGYVYEKGKGLLIYQGGRFKSWLVYAGPFVVMTFFALIPLFIQGDLGPTFLLLLVFLLLFHVSGSPYKVTGFFIFFVAIGGWLAYQIGFPAMVRTRFDLFIYPFERNESLARVLWSLSSGGLTGAGIGYGQPFQIPEVQSDFTFAGLCEELGFVGGATVIATYLILLWRCFKVAGATSHVYKKILSLGIGTLIGVEAGIIILGNLAVIPLTGITLPLISYGGSSLLVHFLMIGILLKISGEDHGEKQE